MGGGMGKKVMYVCIGLFLLVCAYSLGAQNAGAQAGGQIVGFTTNGDNECVITADGDVWYRPAAPSGECRTYTAPPCYVGNFWGGGPTPTQEQTMGQLKARYR